MWNFSSIASELPEESQGVFSHADVDVFMLSSGRQK